MISAEIELIDIGCVSKRLGLPRSFIYEHTRKGSQDRIPCYRFGKHLRFNWSEVAVWIEKHKNK